MTSETLLRRFIQTLPRDLVLDLYDACPAEAQKAAEMVKEKSGLTGRRARELIGQARFRMQEQAFSDLCLLHGGHPLDGDLIPGSDKRVYQPFMRFQGPEHGIILGLAMMSEAGKLPVKNMSRVAGVSLNYHLTPRLAIFDDETCPKPGDIFALFLCARDPADAGKVQQIALGVIDAEYDAFVEYWTIDEFLKAYAPAPSAIPEPESKSKPRVTLKKVQKPFVPPNSDDGAKGDDSEGKAG
ncbi:hypothetical protein AZA_20949 [Nitrospirillum viridazoti Y2]|uniref:Uncharacterized protein n=1 Tax=Nitrospirillum amazonense TaxID=28077 RepID=A0A560IZU6_9PROT|nr:hypothetical protein [Nitrospirillum amazonense]EGY02049.1 hypothetical protein AZA_20949 [Nitrospirillum amazonense Y2]TWB64241.1 hypothetical protein FBZ92_101134 [Nitrospirillum amazonense]